MIKLLKESDDKITANSFQKLISKLEDHGYSCEHYYDMKYPKSNWLYITKNGNPYEAEFYRYSDGEYELYLHNIHPTKRRSESVSEEKEIIRLEHMTYDYPDRRKLAESITNLVFRTNNKNTHMNRLLKTDLKFVSKMYRDRIAKCTTEEELVETLSRCGVNVLKRIKKSLEESKKRCHRNKLTEKSNFDDTQKAIDYYYPKWYYDDMSINDIYDNLEKLGHSQDFIDAVIDGITSRYENEEDYGFDDYDECLTEDSLDDIVRPEIQKRYIWPLYEDSAYEITEIIKKYQNTNRFKNEIKGFDLNDISYMDWPALQLEIECSKEVYVFIRNDIEREGLFVDDDDMEESIQESKVGDVEDSKLPKRAKDYLKSMGWDPTNINGDMYYTMHFSESEDCDLYIDEFGNCYLVVGEYDVKPTDMFYTIVDDYKTDIDDLMKLGDMVASGNDVDKVMELFFG